MSNRSNSKLYLSPKTSLTALTKHDDATEEKKSPIPPPPDDTPPASSFELPPPSFDYKVILNNTLQKVIAADPLPDEDEDNDDEDDLQQMEHIRRNFIRQESRSDLRRKPTLPLPEQMDDIREEHTLTTNFRPHPKIKTTYSRPYVNRLSIDEIVPKKSTKVKPKTGRDSLPPKPMIPNSLPIHVHPIGVNSFSVDNFVYSHLTRKRSSAGSTSISSYQIQDFSPDSGNHTPDTPQPFTSQMHSKPTLARVHTTPAVFDDDIASVGDLKMGFTRSATYGDKKLDSDDDESDDDSSRIVVLSDASNVGHNAKAHFKTSTEKAIREVTEQIKVTSSNPKELFDRLRKVCLDLKKDNNLPIPRNLTFVQFDGVIPFLGILGYVYDKSQHAYVCTPNDRNIAMINYAIMQISLRTSEVNQQMSVIGDIVQLRKRGASKSSNGFPLAQPSNIQIQQSLSCHEDMITDDDDRIRLEELMWQLTHTSNQEAGSTHILLLCYPLVTTATQLFRSLASRFFKDDHDGRVSKSFTSYGSTQSASTGGSITIPELPSSPTPVSGYADDSGFKSQSQSMQDRIMSSFAVQTKVVEIVRHWMNNYWGRDWQSNSRLLEYFRAFMLRAQNAYKNDSDLDENEIGKGLFLMRLIGDTMHKNEIAYKLEISSQQQFPMKNVAKKIPLRRTHSRGKSKYGINFGSKKSAPQHLDIAERNAVHVAEQITHMQFVLFCKIVPRECLNQGWKNKERKYEIAPNITAYIDQFNKISKWIQCSILLAPDLKKRGRTIKKWIKIAEQLFKLRNFQGLAAVYGGLQSNAVHRLAKAWKLVPKKHTLQYDSIRLIMKTNKNFTNLRSLQIQANPPMLPYFGIFAGDLIAIGEINKKVNEDDQSINWTSLCRLSNAINAHVIYQNTPYSNIVKDAAIQEWIDQELDLYHKTPDDFLYLASQDTKGKDLKLKSKSRQNSPRKSKSNIARRKRAQSKSGAFFKGLKSNND